MTEEEVKDPPPAVEELQDQNISTTTQEGEDGPIGPVEEVAAPIEEVKEEEVLTFASEMPVYPGGDLQLQKDIQENITYPEMEKENNIQGTVVIGFVIEKDGSVSNVKILRGVQGGPNLSKEAEKAVKKLRKFTPAKQNGRAVRLNYNVPVRFTLK